MKKRPMHSFRQVLLSLGAPQLRMLGYQYEEALEDSGIRYGFRKNLIDDIYALVFFDLMDYDELASSARFTVHLGRCKTRDLAHWHQGHYEGFISKRLSSVLYLVYGVGGRSYYDQFWVAQGQQQLEAAVQDALQKLEQYGIPWLENLESRMPGISEERLAQFRDTVERIAAHPLEGLGYRAVDCRPFGRVCFGKRLPSDFIAFIAFELGSKSRDYKELVFRVSLFRNKGSEFNPTINGESRTELLGILLWQKCGLRKGPYQYYDWEYSDQAELEAQLEDALEKVESVAVPWLEDVPS